MPVVMDGMGCVTPPGLIEQARMAELSRRYNAATPQQRALIDRIYRGTKIDQRASVLADWAASDGVGAELKAQGTAAVNGPRPGTALEVDALAGLIGFYPEPTDASDDAGPSTADRMAAYEALSLPLAAAACRAALDDAAASAKQVTQIVSVCCTGFAAPGLEVRLIHELGLARTVGRTSVGFMGCHGAVNGLRVARALAAAESDPAARVLLVCTELCTLHFQYGQDPQLAVANALFGDGAAAVVLANQPEPQNKPDNHHDADAASGGDSPIIVRDTASVVLPDTGGEMSWRIGDRGFVMTLSAEVPKQIERHARGFVEPWLAGHGLTIDQVGGWAIHPGGPRVIGAVGSALGLPEGAGDASRAVLADRGNMSSPTVLFIADRLRQENRPRPWVVLAFGPGLVVEAALLQ